MSSKQARAADDAYLEGAKHVQHRDLADAIRSFEKAVRLNPDDSDYSLALIVTRENYVTELVERAAQARSVAMRTLADSLLAQARTLDPHNHIVIAALRGAGAYRRSKRSRHRSSRTCSIRASTRRNSLHRTLLRHFKDPLS
jgi:Flp pilus assembly protein TadD